MKGNTKVIDALNMLLTGELTAMDQYMVQAEICEDLGLNKLHEHFEHEFEEEKGHAKELQDRILFLEGTPDLNKRLAISYSNDIQEMLKFDLQLEYDVADNLRKVIELCENEHDYQSRKMLMPLLEDTEEDHIYWIEQQQGLIKKIGIQNYTQSMM